MYKMQRFFYFDNNFHLMKNNCGYIKFLALFIITITFCCAHVFAQDTPKNKYGLVVIKTKKHFKNSLQNDSSKQMTDLRKAIPNIKFDLKYATKNNFTGKKLYPNLKTAYLRKEAADSLSAVQTDLNKMGLGIIIFDAYRPYAVTEKMWKIVPDDRYAANPKTGSGHNRGIAADLTIIDLKTGVALNMGTAFDNFTDSAHHSFINFPDQILVNRKLLRTTMEKHGFKPLPTEWWHYSLITKTVFELLDVDFNSLRKAGK
jgi:zinc D-Ala-D-Ala dipeptidase